jgi:hypothetical protein
MGSMHHWLTVWPGCLCTSGRRCWHERERVVVGSCHSCMLGSLWQRTRLLPHRLFLSTLCCQLSGLCSPCVLDEMVLMMLGIAVLLNGLPATCAGVACGLCHSRRVAVHRHMRFGRFCHPSAAAAWPAQCCRANLSTYRTAL